MFPFIAFCVSLMSLLLYYSGLEAFVPVPLIITAVLALMGTLFPDPEKPVSSRIVPWLAVVLAASPLAVPFVQAERHKILERRRAAETRPIYQAIDAEIDRLKPLIEQYYRTHGFFPEFDGSNPMPIIDARGQFRQPPPLEGLEPPADPFHPTPGTRMRWAAVRGRGVIIVSVGQDGIAELPLPGPPIDPEPAHPLATFAMLGIDPRERTFEPARGALSLGDVVRWHGTMSYDEAFRELFRSWDRAHGYSPYRPSVLRRATEIDPDPQSKRDAVAAARLFGEADYLAALALSSRAINERHPYEAQWTREDRAAELTRGMALYHLGAFREAADSLANYLVLEPNDAHGHFYLAASVHRATPLGAAGGQQTVTTHLSAASQINPRDPVADQAWQALQAIERRSPPPFPRPWIETQQGD